MSFKTMHARQALSMLNLTPCITKDLIKLSWDFRDQIFYGQINKFMVFKYMVHVFKFMVFQEVYYVCGEL